MAWDLDLFYSLQRTDAEIVGRYEVDRSAISVSGMSSGAAMATQMHVAYSSVFMGVGIVAGGEHQWYVCLPQIISLSSSINDFDISYIFLKSKKPLVHVMNVETLMLVKLL